MLMERGLYHGLTSLEAQKRLVQYGPNLVREKQSNRFIILAKKFWSPIPWMIELTIALQFILEKYTEALIIIALLLLSGIARLAPQSFMRDSFGNRERTSGSR